MIEEPYGEGPRPFVPLSPLATGLALAVLWSVAVVAGVAAAFQGRSTLVVPYAAFVVYLILLSAPVVLFGTRSGVFHPLVFFVLWRGFVKVFRVDVLLASGSVTFHRAVPHFSQAALDQVVAKNFLLETLALLGLYAGYAVMPFLRVPRLPIVSGSAVRAKIAAWMAMSAFAVIVLAMAAGGFGRLLLQRGMAHEERVRNVVGGHWYLLASLATIAPIVWLAFRPRAVRTPFFWLVASASLAFTFLARGSRSSILMTLILLIVVYSLRRRAIPYKVLLLCALSAIVILGVVGQFREATQRVDTVGDVAIDSGIRTGFRKGIEALVRRGTEASGQLAVIARVPEEVGYLYGRSYLSIPMIVVPRAVVGEKPPTAGKLNARLVHERQESAMPTGPVAESFWNFSYAGPVLVFFVFGAILKIVSGVFLVNADHPLVVVGYAYVLMLFTPSSDAMFDFVQAMIAVLFLGFVLALEAPPRAMSPRRRSVA